MITCKQLIEFIAAYVADELEDGERAAFERHLSVCRTCQAYLDSYRKTMTLVQELATDAPVDDVPEELVATILASRGS